MFTISPTPEFGRINAEAQRRYYEQVRPPYLTWHFAVWPRPEEFPENQGDKDGSNNDESQKNHIKNRISWINHVNMGLDKLGFPPEHRFHLAEHKMNASERIRHEAAGEFEKIYKPFVSNDVLSSYPKGLNSHEKMAVACRAEMHSEYVAFTFILPIKWPEFRGASLDPLDDGSDQSDLRPHTGAPFSRSIEKVNNIVSEVFHTLKGVDSTPDLNAKLKGARAWDKLFTDAWKEAMKGIEEGDLFPKAHVFANYRGVVLPRIFLSQAISDHEGQRHIENWKNDGKELFIKSDIKNLPNAKDKDAANHYEIQKEKYGELGAGEAPPETPNRWNRISAGQTLERNGSLRRALHWPYAVVPDDNSESQYPNLYKGSADLPSIEPAFRRRTIANLVLDGSALFASSFGAGLPQDFGQGKDHDKFPLEFTSGRYCLFYCCEAKEPARFGLDRRLDRVVQRMHSIGVRRVISLKNLEAIWSAGYELRSLNRELDRALQKSSQGYADDITRVEAFSKHLADCNRLAPKESSDGAEDDLEFRVSRSKYYSQDFDGTLEDLSIHRIEGWEPLDQFARRRLIPQWRNIQQIGQRLESAQSKIDRLTDLTMAHSSQSLARQATTIGAIAIGAVSFIEVSSNEALWNFFYNIEMPYVFTLQIYMSALIARFTSPFVMALGAGLLSFYAVLYFAKKALERHESEVS